MGNNSYKINGINYTTIATKAAIINKFEECFVDTDGQLIEEFRDLPHLAIELDHPEHEFKIVKTTFELPHRIGSGVFAVDLGKENSWEFPQQLLDKMKKVGPHQAVAFYDPISALLGSFLSHYKNIPSRWSKFTGAVIAGCVAGNTQPVISAGVTIDPLGTNKDEHILATGKNKISTQGLGNIIHLSNDIVAEEVYLNMFLNQSRLKFYPDEVKELLVLLYKYGTLKLLSEGIDLRNRCFLRATAEVNYDEKKLLTKIKKQIKICKEKNLINENKIVRSVPVSYFK